MLAPLSGLGCHFGPCWAAIFTPEGHGRQSQLVLHTPFNMPAGQQGRLFVLPTHSAAAPEQGASDNELVNLFLPWLAIILVILAFPASAAGPAMPAL